MDRTKVLPNLVSTAPKYARVLELRALCAEAELAALEAGLTELRRYLSTPKFDRFAGGNSRVEVADVFLRLDEARSAGLDASFEVLADASSEAA